MEFHIVLPCGVADTGRLHLFYPSGYSAWTCGHAGRKGVHILLKPVTDSTQMPRGIDHSLPPIFKPYVVLLLWRIQLVCGTETLLFHYATWSSILPLVVTNTHSEEAGLVLN